MLRRRLNSVLLLLVSVLYSIESFQGHTNPHVKEPCPGWVHKHTRDKQYCMNKKFVRITPVQGFGNKLNGVVQGVVGAYLLDRCLYIDWIFTELLSTSTSFHAQQSKLSTSDTIKPVYHTRFPRSLKELRNFKERVHHQELINMKVEYRDFLCRLIVTGGYREFDIGISTLLLKQLQKRKNLCVYLERCILQEVLKPNKELYAFIHDVQKDLFKPDSIMIALQIRMGDFMSTTPEEQILLKTGGDKRIPANVLETFWDTAKMHEVFDANTEKSGSIFVSSDSQMALMDAQKAFHPQKIHFSPGSYRHSDLIVQNDSSAIKMLADWYILSKADVVIQGPWSTFVEKALVYSTRKQKVIICHEIEAGTNNSTLILSKYNWGCFHSVVKDTLKGPRAVRYAK